jgi:ribonuclease G
MANPRNREAVEEALKTELERDRTKTYVVEISPLGLVEMTRQNVAHGPREILTKRCPTCEGDGIVVSEASAAVDAERKLRTLAAASRTGAFRVELNAHVASILIGPAAQRLRAIEERTRRRFFIVGKEGVPAGYFKELERGPVARLTPESTLEEDQERQLKLVEVGLHDSSAGVAKDGDTAIHVAGAAGMVGKRVKVRITRILNGVAYAELVAAPGGAVEAPITAEELAEKPTRARRSRTAKPEAVAKPEAAAEPVAEEEAEEVEAEADAAAEAEPAGEEQPKRKRTRRGSRGGRKRKRKPAAATAEASENGEPAEAPVLIHVPDPDLGSAEANGEATEGVAPRKKRTRRGSRGGRRRKKPAAAQTDTSDS